MNPDPTTAGGEISSSEVFVWRADGQPFTIELAFDVIDRMTPGIADAFRALRHRGAEVGGILLGQVRQDQGLTVTIADFVPIPIERKFGPSYHLSPADFDRFDKECAKWRPGASANNLALVGYYRSNTRPELGLFPPDLELLASRLPEPYAVALLVKPYIDKAFDAAFFIRKNESLTSGGRGVFSFRRFDLGGGAAPGLVPQAPPLEPLPAPAARSRMLTQNIGEPPPVVERRPAAAPPQSPPAEPLAPIASRPVPPSPAPTPTPAPVSVPAPVEATTPHAPPPPRPVTPFLPAWALLLLGVVLAAAGVAGGYLWATNNARDAAGVEALRNYTLGLHATTDADHLVITWDTTAPAFRDAVRGLLTIEDGDNWKTLTIEAADLARGRVRYRPVSKQISFRLDVLMDDHAGATEFVSVTRQ